MQEYYDILEVMNLEQIHKFEKGKFMFRLVNNKLPSNFCNRWSPVNEHNHNLRSSSSGNIREQFARTIYGTERIQSNGAKLWNEIPTQIQLCESLNIFVNKYRNCVMGKQDVGQQKTENQLLQLRYLININLSITYQLIYMPLFPASKFLSITPFLRGNAHGSNKMH